MRLMTSNFNQPQFMAHTYKVMPKKDLQIRTDNNPYLGEEPELVITNQSDDVEDVIPMEKEENLYCASPIENNNIKYHINYQDTGNIDYKDGKDYEINYKKMRQDATLALCNQFRQPLVQPLKKGKTVGKVVSTEQFNGDISKIKEPFILVTPSRYEIENPNLSGYIFTSDNFMDFSFGGFQARNNADVCVFVFDPKVIENLENLHNENIELEVKDNFIKFNKTDKAGKTKIFPKVEVPKLKPCDKVLTSKEYSPDVIGAKAVNLRRLEELKEQGKIDITIPKSIALPHGYIQNLYDNNEIQEKTYQEKKDIYPCKEATRAKYSGEYAEKSMTELRKIIKENGITSEEVMVRSAFSGDDLPDYPSQNMYDSTTAFLDSSNEERNNKELYNRILNNVALSKWGLNPTLSRQKYQIPDDDIKVGVIIQDKIDYDSSFKVHTNTDSGNLKVELYTDEWASVSDSHKPHVFSYDKATGKLSYNSIQMMDEGVTFNEDGEIIDIDPIEEDLSNNEKIMEQIKKVAQNALVVEKEFGAPQDIEGGLKDDDIYFWQTRNIVR